MFIRPSSGRSTTRSISHAQPMSRSPSSDSHTIPNSRPSLRHSPIIFLKRSAKMCSGTSSPGSATRSSGNRGKPDDGSEAIAEVYLAPIVPPPLHHRERAQRPRPPGSPSGAAGGQQQVVEDRRGQQRLEHLLVEPLQQQITVERSEEHTSELQSLRHL